MFLPYVNINGLVVPQAEASLQLTDLALLRGYGIFDFFRVREGRPTFMEDHLDRFFGSAEKMALDMPVSREVLKEQLADLIVRNEVRNGTFRLLLTGGYSEDGYTPGPSNLILLMQDFKGYGAAHFEQGIQLMPYEYTREIPDVKTINYSVPIRLRQEISKAGAADVLYHSKGYISESSRANFFIVSADGAVVTPKEDILFGITRKHLLRIAKDHYKVEERPIHLEELATAREAFISSSTKGALGITKVGKWTIGEGRPGPVTKDLKQRFEAHALAESQLVQLRS